MGPRPRSHTGSTEFCDVTGNCVVNRSVVLKQHIWASASRATTFLLGGVIGDCDLESWPTERAVIEEFHPFERSQPSGCWSTRFLLRWGSQVIGYDDQEDRRLNFELTAWTSHAICGETRYEDEVRLFDDALELSVIDRGIVPLRATSEFPAETTVGVVLERARLQVSTHQSRRSMYQFTGSVDPKRGGDSLNSRRGTGARFWLKRKRVVLITARWPLIPLVAMTSGADDRLSL
jgi:hypothetical protein